MAERGANGPQPSSLSLDACEDLNDLGTAQWNLNHEPAIAPPADDEPTGLHKTRRGALSSEAPSLAD